jgi:hypothetical protein
VGATDRGILWRVDGDNTAKPTDRDNDVVYLAILGIVGLIALVAAVPTSLPRRRAVVEDDIPLSGEDDDGNS